MRIPTLYRVLQDKQSIIQKIVRVNVKLSPNNM